MLVFLGYRSSNLYKIYRARTELEFEKIHQEQQKAGKPKNARRAHRAKVMAAAEAKPEPVAKPVSKTPAKPVAKPAAKPAAKPSAKPATKPTAKPAAKRTPKASTKPTKAAAAKASAQQSWVQLSMDSVSYLYDLVVCVELLLWLSVVKPLEEPLVTVWISCIM